MIDLRKRTLPNTVVVGGKSYFIKTDFRDWLQFGELAKESRRISEYCFLFEEIPCESDEPKEVLAALAAFYANPNITPYDSGDEHNGNKSIDLIEDGEYILSAFIQAYGIDLVEVEYLHWHKFMALLRSLPESTKLTQIMGFRSYKKSNRTQEREYERMREIWSYRDAVNPEQEKLLEEINNEFYATV